MGRHREKHNEFEYEDGAEAFLSEIDYELDDSEFADQFQPKKSRQKTKRARNARRRIEEYREERDLASRLSEYYDYSDD